jgi:hypothetical protein
LYAPCAPGPTEVQLILEFTSKPEAYIVVLQPLPIVSSGETVGPAIDVIEYWLILFPGLQNVKE